MKLIFKGHDCRYAAEQILLTLFPEEKPEYEGGSDENSAVIRLGEGKEYMTATARIIYRGKTGRGTARARLSSITGELAKTSKAQMLIKLAFFRAALDMGADKPAWGAITGIRPGTIFTSLLRSGLTEDAAMKQMMETYYIEEPRVRLLRDTSRASLAVQAELEPRDIALYVGIPFCPTRCAYCSFVSQQIGKNIKLIPRFLEVLYRELSRLGEIVRELELRVIAVYIGGGTPTTLSAEELTELIGVLRSEFDLSAVREFSVEAGRPDTITAEKLTALREGGVTRISVNPQSMSDSVLAAIGRSHSADEVREAYRLAVEKFGGDINMDLIAGLPADTVEGFKKTLTELIEMDPANITIHTLALKKGTKITLEGTRLPAGDEVRGMLDFAMASLTEAGYRPYYLYRQKFMNGGFENVGWAKPGTESLYNVLIMEELCTILAAGGGASTKLVNVPTGRIERIFDYKYPKEYIEGEEKTLAEKEKIIEFYAS